MFYTFKYIVLIKILIFAARKITFRVHNNHLQ